MITLDVHIVMTLDMEKNEWKDCDLREHIEQSIRRTGDKHPQDPLFGAFDKVRVSKMTRRLTAAEYRKKEAAALEKKLREGLNIL